MMILMSVILIKWQEMKVFINTLKLSSPFNDKRDKNGQY
jgi:hypothetical protein